MAERVCPVWIGYFLASPLRKLIQNPEKILSPHIKEGMTVLDIGCAMGFFSLPLANMVGPSGKVICVDLQEKMLSSLEKRAKKAGLIDRIEMRLCKENSLELTGLDARIDFALASAVVHEVPDNAGFFSQLQKSLKPGSELLMIEPKGHVSPEGLRTSIANAEKNNFEVISRDQNKKTYTFLMRKQAK